MNLDLTDSTASASDASLTDAHTLATSDGRKKTLHASSKDTISFSSSATAANGRQLALHELLGYVYHNDRSSAAKLAK